MRAWENLEKASLALGDAALDPKLWPDVIDAISRAVGATGAALLQGNVRTADIPRTPSAAELIGAYFKNNWASRDIWAERSVPLLLSGASVVTDQDILSPAEMRALPFYNEHVCRHGFKWYAAVGLRAQSDLWGLCLYRTNRDGPFEKPEKRALSSLSRRLTEAASLSTFIGRTALSSAMTTLSAVAEPTLAVDYFGRVIDGNAAAHALFDDDVRVDRQRRLVVTDTQAGRLLDKLKTRITTTLATAALPCEPILVQRKSKAPIFIHVLPVPAAAQTPFLGARALLRMMPLEEKSGPAPDKLKKHFELTAAEARVASAIAEGRSLEELSDRWSVSRETVRNQLKSVFAKTGTHRQSELVALLARL